jgi:homoserine O-succinyltransferase
MPVCIEDNTQTYHLLTGRSRLDGKSATGHQGWGGGSVHIGLINNMPDGALEATERQFLALLGAAAREGMLVRVSFYALPNVPRNDWGRHRVKTFYSSVESLYKSQLDGLIVTGREPRTPNLKDEPYWQDMTRVLEWAEDNTSSTVWSCLAAHAALLHMDGIARRKSTEKRCGVFDCLRLSDHPLTAGLPSRFKVPHSRWNDVAEDDLAACGYSVLSQVQDAGADTIVKQRQNSLFVFLQGHPEYESDTLLHEYRRDVKRYLSGESNVYPSMPQGYFDQSTKDALTALQEKAISGYRHDLPAGLAAALDGKGIARTWRSAAERLYSNWLAYVSTQKEHRVPRAKLATNAHG